MRLWHKDLIPFLPRKQLIGQWRECCLIAKNINVNGTPNHILVNKIMDYPIDHFFRYCVEIKQEMIKRHYVCNEEKCKKYFQKKQYKFHCMNDIFTNWHNERYLRQCIYNLEEKAMCGGISKEEWNKIFKQYNKVFDLYDLKGDV